MTSGQKTIMHGPGLDVLGCLYNVLTSPYSKRTSVGRLAVNGIDVNSQDNELEIDIDKQIYYTYPNNVGGQVSNEVEIEILVEESYTKFTNSLAVRVGIAADYGAFSAEVTAGLNLETTETDQKFYALFLDQKRTARFSFNGQDLINARNGLSLESSFKTALNDSNNSPANLFNNYGTHVISGVNAGGQIHFTWYADKQSYSSTEDFTLDAKAKYEGLTSSVQVTGSLEASTSAYKETSQISANLLISGGSDDGQAAIKPDATDSSGYTTWLTSVDTNPAFLEFLENGLIPVWELCDTDARRDELRDAYQGALRVSNTFVRPSNQGTHYKPDKYDYEDLDKIRNDAGYAYSDDVPIKEANTIMQDYAAAYNQGIHWVSQTDQEVMVGFGARINNDKHVTRIKIACLNLGTGLVAYYAVGGTVDDDYEKWFEVPKGSVMTGIGLWEHNQNLAGMEINYQKLDYYGNIPYGETDTIYLEPTTQTQVEGSMPGDGWELFYKQRENGNPWALTGIFVVSSNSENGFVRLVLKTSKIAPIPSS